MNRLRVQPRKGDVDHARTIELYEKFGLSMIVIAARVGCTRSHVNTIIGRWKRIKAITPEEIKLRRLLWMTLNDGTGVDNDDKLMLFGVDFYTASVGEIEVAITKGLMKEYSGDN